MPDPTCILLADDFTGACDTALQFVCAGLSARVQTTGEPAGNTDVLVWDTETRNCPVTAARQRVTHALQALATYSNCLWYKKIDSTLRGPIGAELEIVMRGTESDLCVLAPALPQAGRTTLEGVHYVDGIPLHRTESGRDPGAPVSASSISDLLAATTREPDSSLSSDVTPGPTLSTAPVPLAHVRAGVDALRTCLSRLARPVVAIVDARVTHDLEVIATAAARVDPPPLLCGCAGLAAFVPAAFGLRSRTPRPRARTARGRLLLVVSGSAARRTRHQLDYLRRHLGAREIHVAAHADPRDLAAEAAAGSTAETIIAILSLGPDEPDPDTALRVMARTVHHLVRDPALSGVAVTGGTTAVTLLSELRAGTVDVLEPVSAQVPLCRLVDGPAAGLHLITKGGGLGEEDVFVRVAHRFLPGTREP